MFAAFYVDASNITWSGTKGAIVGAGKGAVPGSATEVTSLGPDDKAGSAIVSNVLAAQSRPIGR